MSKPSSPINGVLFFIFWLVLLLSVVYLFDRWYRINVGGIVEQQTVGDQRQVMIRINRNDSYVATGSINGVPVRFIIDTGANTVAVPATIARKAGLTSMGATRIVLAAGETQAQLTRIHQIQIGDIFLNNVGGMIMKGGGDRVLLGMSALKRLEIRHENNYLLLIQSPSTNVADQD